MLSCIKFLSEYLCPQCRTRKSQVRDLGTAKDRRRQKQKHQDSVSTQSIVYRVRWWIFEKGVSVSAKKVQDTLKYCITPIVVSKFHLLLQSLTDCEECFLKKTFSSRFRLLSDVSWWHHARFRTRDLAGCFHSQNSDYWESGREVCCRA